MNVTGVVTSAMIHAYGVTVAPTPGAESMSTTLTTAAGDSRAIPYTFGEVLRSCSFPGSDPFQREAIQTAMREAVREMVVAEHKRPTLYANVQEADGTVHQVRQDGRP